MSDTIFLTIISIPPLMVLWYLLSRISLRRYRVVDQSFSIDKERVPYFVVEYLSPVGWQQTVSGRIPGDGWTYTVQWPYSFKSMKEAKAFCKKHGKLIQWMEK